MKRFLIAIGITILTSFYFFPFNTVFLPTVNTKMALAAFSIPLYILVGAKQRDSKLDTGIIGLSISGFIVSLVGIVSVVINNTGDYTYASYFVSMWVWLGGAYTVVKVIEVAYKRVTIRMIGNFLIIVCVVQCLLSQIINANDAVASVVDNFMTSTGYMGRAENRLYGIGCALDVAGLRFCTVLLMITFFCLNPLSEENPGIEQCLYIASFLIVSLFGCMIARTTTIGIILSAIMGLYLYCSNRYKSDRVNVRNASKMFFNFMIIVIPIIIAIYNTNPTFRENVRFGFEGFFSLAEQGDWDVKSNKQLLSMVVWPENLKTWLIGDAYFDSPQNDDYYTGPLYEYYKGTDVGYCRFIFYFGLLGLVAFSCVFVLSAIICSKRHPKYTPLFLGILIVNFLGWIKVSSDIFLVFAIFLCVIKDDDMYENSLPNALDV